LIVRRTSLLGLGSGLLVLGWLVIRAGSSGDLVPSPPCSSSGAASDPPGAPSQLACPPAEPPPGRVLQAPTGSPASLSCDDARRIVTQARNQLAAPPVAPDPRHFADALVDWVDPHGLWTAAPDSPMATALRAHARAVIAELETPVGGGPCEVSHELGATMAVWVNELRGVYEAAERSAPAVPIDQAIRFASLAAFQDGFITRPAKSLATELGYRAGVVRRSMGPEGERAATAARERLLPGDSLDWSTVILAGAVRAYLPQIDPHGGWAPLDEETSLYEIDLEAAPPPRLWRKMTRTAVGVRIEETHVDGLKQGDVVLSVGDRPRA
jgi:carboxyl-terminal processing protease